MRLLQDVRSLRSRSTYLNREDLKPSRIYRVLNRYSSEAVLAYCIALDSALARDNVEQYLKQWRWVRPRLTGSYLKARGVPPGPVYRQILDKLLYARLDGEIGTATEEEALAQRLLLQWKKSSA